MDAPRESYRPRSNSMLPWVLLVLVLFGVGVYVFRGRIAAFLAPPIPAVVAPVAAPAPTVAAVKVTSSSVLQKISQLNNLEAVAYKLSVVVTAEKDGSGWRLWQDAQKAMLVGEGTVTAGVNLGDLKESDIIVSEDGKAVSIKLPPSQILATNLQRVQVYDTQTGLFGTVNLDPKLIDQANVEARSRLQASACEGNILAQANTSAQHQMQSLITMLGLKADVSTTTSAPCPATVVE
jgi:hypothetical protein